MFLVLKKKYLPKKQGCQISAKSNSFGLSKVWAFFGKELVHKPKKAKFLKNEKDTPGIHPRSKYTKFQPNWKFLSFKFLDTQTNKQTNTQTISDSNWTDVENSSLLANILKNYVFKVLMSQVDIIVADIIVCLKS